VLSVCLTALFSSFNLLKRSDSLKTGGINKAMNDVLTGHKFHLLCLANTFKYKTKKSQNQKQSTFVTLSYDPPPDKGKTKRSILHISKKTNLQRAVCRCLNCFMCDTLHSADPSALC
jgi:hypothetical protein